MKLIKDFFNWLLSMKPQSFYQPMRSESSLPIDSQYDQLTNLPNRNLFIQQLSKAIAESQINKSPIALLLIDLDRFKKINDTLGHEAGDQVLRFFVERVKSCLRKDDLFGRWGGDEFAILLYDVTEEEDVAEISRRIIQSLKNPVEIFGFDLHIKVSMGITLYPKNGHTAETLLRNTDTALSDAKIRGRNKFQFYDAMLHKNSTKMLKMEHYLHQALDNKEFSLHYQPQLNFNKGSLCGVEALIRWESPHLGKVSPADFIPLAEETGLIEDIGEWVLETACDQMVAWQKSGLCNSTICVNISPIQLKNPRFIEQVEDILNRTGLSPSLLDLEITENSLMEEINSVKDNIDQLLKMGVQISLDDFGTGYSSLGYLKNFPFHTLKIDQSFIRNLKYSDQDSALISAIISIGKIFNIRVIAEGTEYIEQIELLTSLGCDKIQGYWFSKPLPAEQIEKFILDHLMSNRVDEIETINQGGGQKGKAFLSLVA